jgi:tetratricopeptide (TPR) repeat protein
MPLPSPDMALRIVDAMTVANCAAAAARPLFKIALDFEMKGFAEAAEPLRRRAVALDPEVEQSVLADAVTEISDLDDASFAPLAFSSGDFGSAPLSILASEGSSTNGGNGAPAPIEDEVTSDFGMITLQNSFESSLEVLEPDPAASSALDISAEAGTTDQAQTIAALLADEADLDPADYRSVVARAEEHLTGGDTERALRVFLAAGRTAFNAGESRVAENVYVEMVKHDPNHLEALQGLTEIAHINGERAKIVRYGSELGDVLLARERYADAKLEFERVLQFDPGNEKAASRVRRLNSIDGMESVTARPLAPVASEVKGATVTVRKEPGRTQSMIDLSEIMSEFQTAVAGQVPLEDAQSHYDLGMTYLEMGMPEQAVDEFEIASRADSHRVRSLEMLARCLITAGRADEALAAVEEAAASGDEPDRQASLFACRGLALEALGRIPEALHALERALSIDPALEMARDGIARLGDDANEAAA